MGTIWWSLSSLGLSFVAVVMRPSQSLGPSPPLGNAGLIVIWGGQHCGCVIDGGGGWSSLGDAGVLVAVAMDGGGGGGHHWGK